MNVRYFKVGLVVVSLLFVLFGCNSKGVEGNGTNGETPKIVSLPVIEEEVVQVGSLEE